MHVQRKTEFRDHWAEIPTLVFQDVGVVLYSGLGLVRRLLSTLFYFAIWFGLCIFPRKRADKALDYDLCRSLQLQEWELLGNITYT